MIIRRQQWKTDIREYLSVLAIVVFLLAIAGGTYYYANKVIFMKIIEFTSQNLIPIVLIVFILNFVFLHRPCSSSLMFNRWSKSLSKRQKPKFLHFLFLPFNFILLTWIYNRFAWPFR